jgi:hypothetical protein
LDLSIQQLFLANLFENASPSELANEFSAELEAVKEKMTVLIDGKQWSRVSGVLYCEDRRAVPKERVLPLLVWLHNNHGHPEINRLLPIFKRLFYSKLTDTKLKEQFASHRCVCAKAKQNNPSDRGLLRALPIPYMANSVLYVDFIDGMPKYGGYDFVMIVVCGFSRYTQAWPLSKKSDGEQVLKMLVENWFMPLGGPKEVHSDCDVRFKSPTGFWRSVLAKHGIEVTFSTPYGKRKNPLVERQIRHFEEIMRVFLAESKSRDWVKLVPLTCWTMNRQIIGTTETTPQESFHFRPGWDINYPVPAPGNPNVETWVQFVESQRQMATRLLEKIRAREQTRRNRRRTHATYNVGDFVLVSADRLPAWSRNKIEFPWFGPFKVVEVLAGSAFVRVSPRMGGTLHVGFSHLKHYWDEVLLNESPDEVLSWRAANEQAAQEDLENDPMTDLNDVSVVEPEADVQMTDAEQKALGFYEVEAIVKHDYKQGWKFLTLWAGYDAGDATWEPPKAFSLGGGEVNKVFEKYCSEQDLPHALAACRAISAKQPRNRKVVVN